MATRTKEPAVSHVEGKHLAMNLLLGVVVLAVAALLVVLVTAPEPVVERGSAFQRARAAEAARYDAMTDFYTALAEAPQRARAAEAARYDAMTAYYTALAEAPQRAQAAAAARYEAMTAHWTAVLEQNHQRARAAEAARYDAMTDFYTALAEGR